MRSIRRSLTGYLIAWSLITVALVWVVMDRVTAKALSEREKDGSDLIENQYKQRCVEELKKTDDALLYQARSLYALITENNAIRLRVEQGNYRIRNDIAPLMFMTNPLAEVAWTSTANSPSVSIPSELAPLLFLPNAFTQAAWTSVLFHPHPSLDILARMYFLNLPLPEVEYLQGISETSTGTQYHQINAPSGRGLEWHSKSLNGRKLPFESKEIDKKFDKHEKPDTPVAWVSDYETIENSNETVRRIIFRGARQVFSPRFGRPVAPAPLPQATASSGASSTIPTKPVVVVTTNRVERERTPPPPSDSRLYIQCARPKAEIDARLASFADDRDDARSKLSEDIKFARKTTIVQTVAVALVAILAIAIGGPVIVGSGLRPVGKLSDAVSRVSEKDFKLPHDGRDLAEELVPIHSRLTQTLDMLQRAFTREKQAVADISHELKTPITALMATIDVALRKPRTPEEYREKLQECRDISKQLGQLVERIMKLATLDSGNDRNDIARTDALELCSGSAAIIRPLAEQNRVALKLHMPDDLIELDTDPGKLREMLMNLLHNAVEYNRAGGTIDFSLWREGSKAVFEVRDTGIGMTTEIKEKIFERFFRADPSRHATGVHAGLGLAIVNEYISRLNGTIVVESEPGQGSTFRITLPALPLETALAQTSQEPVVAGS